MMKKAIKHAKALGLTEQQLQQDIAHYKKTGQILNRAVAIAIGLTDD